MTEIKEIIAGQMRVMSANIERYAGKEICDQVMAGSDEDTTLAGPMETALWMKAAIDRLDALTDEETRRQIMTACGRHCNEVFNKETEEAKARRLKYETEEEFLKDELQPPPDTGVRFERDGDVIYNYYTPRRYGKGMRCYCYLIGALPEDMTASPTCCLCSRAWMEKYWECALGRPIKVELGETAISSGSDECKFIVHLQ